MPLPTFTGSRGPRLGRCKPSTDRLASTALTVMDTWESQAALMRLFLFSIDAAPD